MLIVTGTVEVSETGVASMKTAATVMGRASRAEDGCHVYAFWQDLEQPNLFRVYEEWESADALKAHGETEHMAAFRKSLGEIGVLSRNIARFEPGPMKTL